MSVLAYTHDYKEVYIVTPLVRCVIAYMTTLFGRFIFSMGRDHYIGVGVGSGGWGCGTWNGSVLSTVLRKRNE